MGAGLYGRTVGSFQNRPPGRDLPSHTITSGDIVAVVGGPQHQEGQNDTSGVVVRVRNHEVNVAFQDTVDNLDLADSQQYRYDTRNDS